MQSSYTMRAGEYTSVVRFLNELTIPETPKSGGLYVCDENTARFAPKDPSAPALILPAGEKYKNIDVLRKILDKAQSLKLGRDSLFVGIGGGVITDITAFAASIYQRGARLALVPTTLLAMADAAVGGKTGVDYGNFKNSVGTFYPAADIYMCAQTLDSLPEYEFRSGLAEVLKTALLFVPELYQTLKTEREAILRQTRAEEAKDRALWLGIIEYCAKAKCAVVEEDMKESGKRMLLNLGHTFAHALETFVGLGSVSHGEAVAWGIGRAAALGKAMGITDPEYAGEVLSVLKSYNWSAEAVHPSAEKIEPNKRVLADRLWEIMYSDKKKRNGAVQFVIQKRLTETIVLQADEKAVKAALCGDCENR